jgi:hypothetical protein
MFFVSRKGYGEIINNVRPKAGGESPGVMFMTAVIVVAEHVNRGKINIFPKIDGVNHGEKKFNVIRSATKPIRCICTSCGNSYVRISFD